MAAKFLQAISTIASGVAGAASLAYFCVYSVDAGHRAIMFDRLQGIKSEVQGEGLHFMIPILQKPIIYEVRTRYTTISSETGSKDLQTVGIHLRLLYKPDSAALPTIHKKLGPDYDERVLPSLGNEVLKAVVAQYDASELITQREFVSTKIREALTRRAMDFNILLDDVSITHLNFSTEFNTAIERKQVAQQEAERSKYVVLKAEQMKQAAIIRAEGEAEAARLLGQATRGGPGFVQLRSIEAAREIAETLAKSKNISYVPNNAGIILNMGNQPLSPPSRELTNSSQEER